MWGLDAQRVRAVLRGMLEDRIGPLRDEALACHCTRPRAISTPFQKLRSGIRRWVMGGEGVGVAREIEEEEEGGGGRAS